MTFASHCAMVDGSRFDEFKERYAPTLVTGFARLHGFLIGIIANNGVLFSESALKATPFIEMCNSRHSAGVSAEHHRLHGRTAVRTGRHRERRRQDGARGGDSVVPKFTIIIGGSFGAGNYGMCGRAYGRGFSGCGRTRASRSWGVSRLPVSDDRQARTACP